MRRKIVAAVLALPLAMSGCSGSDTPGPATPGPGAPAPAPDPASGLLGALGQARATAQTRVYIEYGKPKDDKAKLYPGISGIGKYSELMVERLKLDPRTFTTALTVGQPPNAAGILWGDYDTGAVTKVFTDAKARQDGDVWALGEDNAIRADGPLAEFTPPTGFNKVRVTAGSFAYAGSSAGLATVTEPGQDTLAKDKDIQALAGCLKDVVAATITTSPRDPMPLAVGLSADGTETLCVLPAEGKADDVRTKITDKLGTGTAGNRQPWKELLPDASAEVVDGQPKTVRLTTKPQRPGTLFTALVRGDLPLPR